MAFRPGLPRRNRRPMPHHEDLGLQPERTVMSWGRTGLATTVVALLLLRWYPSVGFAAFLPVIIAAVGASFIQLSQRRRYSTQTVGITNEQVSADFWAVLWMTVLVLALAITAVAAIWWA